MRKLFFLICFLNLNLSLYADIPPRIKIYFTDPPYSSGNIEKEFVDFIERANNTEIYAAFYRIDLATITDTLNSALNHGCTVYLISDDGEGNTSAYQALTVKKKLAKHSGLMHNKFCVLKDSAVWTGSWNPTYSDTYQNNNNAMVIYSSGLAQIYEDEFFQIWNSSGGTTKTANNVSGREEIVDGIKIKVYFSPYSSPTVTQALRTVLSDTKKSVYFALYSFTEDTLGDSLAGLVNQGKKVYGIFDLEQFVTEKKYSEYEKLRSAGAVITFDGNRDNLHHKFAIIDPFAASAKLIAGSANWSVSANTKNDENILIIYSAEIAKTYYQEFLKLWRQANPVTNTGQKAIDNLIVYPSPAVVQQPPTENYINLSFDLGNNVENVEIKIYNLIGEKVKSITFADFTAGIPNNKKIFLTNDSGENLASGIYLVKVEVETPDGIFYEIKKFAIIR